MKLHQRWLALKKFSRQSRLLLLSVIYALVFVVAPPVQPPRLLAQDADCQERTFDADVKYSNCEETACDPGTAQASSTQTGTSLASAIKVDAPFTGEQITPTAIILHWTAGEYSSPEQFMAQLRSRVEPGYPNGRAVQLTVDKSGTVYQLSESLETRPMQTVADQGWNDVSIAIEIESGSFAGDSAPYPQHEADIMNNEPQYQAVLSTVRELMATYQIENVVDTAGKKGVLGHLDINPGGSSDPGPNYLARVRNDLGQDASAGGATSSQTTPIAANCVCSAGNGNFTGSNNQEIVFNYLVGKGLSPQAAAGFVGNFMVESGHDIDPTAVNASNHRGIAQWDAGDRWPRLVSYAEATGGRDPFDLTLQLEFVWFELTGESEIEAPGVQGNKEHATYEAVINAPGPREAAEIIERLYERSGGALLTERQDNAQAVFDTYGHNAGGGGGGSCSGAVNAEGYAFPLEGVKDEIRAFTSLPCTAGPNGCHHDNTPAFDLIVGSERDATLGRKVYAIHDGTITKVKPGYNGRSYCVSIGLEQNNSLIPDDDGWKYAYLHIENPLVAVGQQVRAGEVLAEVGRTECALNTQTHLHIDRGLPKGHEGGSDAFRDPGFIDLINALYEELP